MAKHKPVRTWAIGEAPPTSAQGRTFFDDEAAPFTLQDFERGLREWGWIPHRNAPQLGGPRFIGSSLSGREPLISRKAGA